MENLSMSELRWMLLGLGVLFLAGLALWESRRGRQARQADLERLAPGQGMDQGAEPEHDWRVERGGAGQPDLMEESDPWEEPELLLDEPAEVPLPSFSARDPERESVSRPLPVYALRTAPGESAGAGRRLDPILDFAGDPLLDDAMESGPVISAAAGAGFDEFGVGPVSVIDPPVLARAAGPEAMAPDDEPGAVHEPAVGYAADEAPAPAIEAAQPGPVVPVARVEPASELTDAPVLLPPLAEPIVAWPEDPADSRIFSVRILAPREKFQGRAVRLALMAQGFVPGKFSIYHKPVPDGRALLSVASLTKPGTFDGARVDSQRFHGLNLFAVLPGPLPAAQAVDELLQVADTLAARLQGVLKDDRGEPLSPARAGDRCAPPRRPTRP